MASKLVYPSMKNKDNIIKLPLISKYQLVLIILIISFIQAELFSTKAMAEVEAAFLYTLSDFNGPVPYNWVNISVDEERKEIYVVDPKERDVTIFNEVGMEVYRFGDDGSLGSVIDAAALKDGRIVAISYGSSRRSIIICNYRGEPVSALELKNFPPGFSGFFPQRVIFRRGLLYLLDSSIMKIAVTDTDGLFERGYDIRSLLGIEEHKMADTAIEGFSVDQEGNMLFTVPVKFVACRLSPDGEIIFFGSPGSSPGRFNLVGGIVADDWGYYYVADRLKNAILVFDANFQFQLQFGYRGPGKERLTGPRGLALDGEDRLYVSQVGSKGVSVFKINHTP